MKRQRLEEEHTNHERWVISYADFITLLFAFFVVMYSVSSVNEGKYKVLSESLDNVFNAQPKSFDPVEVGDQRARQSNDRLIEMPVPGDYPSNDDYKYSVEGLFDDVDPGAARQGERRDEEMDALTKLSDELALKLQQQLDSEEIDIRNNGEWIELNIKANVLYPSGSANLSGQARDILDSVADTLKTVANPVHVEGYTDNIPITTARFPSNWELSAARAASVVRFLQQSEINPGRLAAVGYGEYRPIADNSTADGRARNRRIALIISRAEPGVDMSPTSVPEANVEAAAGGGSNKPAQQTTVRVMRLEGGGLLFSNERPQAPAAAGGEQP